MARESWLDHPAIGALQGGIRTRLGISPNHPSFRVGVLRTHLLTAIRAYAAAQYLATDVEVRLRSDDTDAQRADRRHLPSLVAELAITAAIPTTPIMWHQSDRAGRYAEALDALDRTGVIRDVGGIPCLDLISADRLLPDPSRAVSASVVNMAAPSSAHPRHLIPMTRRDRAALWHLASVVDDIDAGINFVVRGTDKVPATGIQHRLRRLLGDAEPVAYLFLPKLREAGGRPVRVSELAECLVRPSSIRWYLAEPYLDGKDAPQTFTDLVYQVRYYLPTPRDGFFDLARLSAFDRKISPQLDPAIAADELQRVVKGRNTDLVARICHEVRRPLHDQLNAYRQATAQREPHLPEAEPASAPDPGSPTTQTTAALPSGR